MTDRFASLQGKHPLSLKPHVLRRCRQPAALTHNPHCHDALLASGVTSCGILDVWPRWGWPAS